MATQEIKLINGKRYIYLTYYDEKTKKKKTEYCGPDGKIDSKNKAIKREIEILESKINKDQSKLDELKSSLSM